MTTSNNNLTQYTVVAGGGGGGGSGGGSPNGGRGGSAGIINTTGVITPNWPSNGLSIQSSIGEPVFSITNDGKFVYGDQSVRIEDVLKAVTLMKKLAFDVAVDPELSKKLPYLKDAAHNWVMNDLKR